MPVETGTYISDLVATNPVGATDPKSQGDDHIRLLKSTIKATFPNIDGAVTADQDDLNKTANGFEAELIISGELADARLSDNVPLLDGSNAWTGAHTHSADSTWADGDEVRLGTGGDLRLYHDGTDSYIDNDTGDLVITSVGDITLNGVDVTNYARTDQSNDFTGTGSRDSAPIVISSANPDLAFYETDGGTNEKGWDILAQSSQLEFRTFTDAGGAGVTWLEVTRDGTSVPSVDFPLSSGRLQYGGEEVGFRGLTDISLTTDHTFVLSDAGKARYHNSGTPHTWTIPANASTSFPDGTVLTMINLGSGDLTIAITSDTLIFAGSGDTGSRTLGQYGVATAIKISSTTWIISGTGLS